MSELELFITAKNKPPAKAAAVEKLGTLVDALELPRRTALDYAKNREVFLAKYLVARKWNVDNAFKMVQDAANDRKQRQLDSTPLFPSPIPVRGYTDDELRATHGTDTRAKGELDLFSGTLRAAYAGGWHKTDKAGRPIYIERSGHIRVREYVALSKRLTPPGSDPCWPSLCGHIHCNEIGGVILSRENEKREALGIPPVHQCVVIMDASGLGLGHLYNPGLNILKASSDHDQRYYPEGMARLYVANAPAMISVAWAIIKPWLDSAMQKKIVFLKPAATKARLLEDIDAANLPKFLGGECDCDGECIPDVGVMDESLGAIDDGDVAATEEVAVARGKSTLKTFPTKQGETVFWEFATDKHDITVSAFAVTKEGKTPIETITRVTSGAGSFTAPDDCDLQLNFDNGFSWMHSKTVQLRVSRTLTVESPQM